MGLTVVGWQPFERGQEKKLNVIMSLPLPPPWVVQIGKVVEEAEAAQFVCAMQNGNVLCQYIVDKYTCNVFVDLHIARLALDVVWVNFAPHCSALHKSGARGKKQESRK